MAQFLFTRSTRLAASSYVLLAASLLASIGPSSAAAQDSEFGATGVSAELVIDAVPGQEGSAAILYEDAISATADLDLNCSAELSGVDEPNWPWALLWTGGLMVLGGDVRMLTSGIIMAK